MSRFIIFTQKAYQLLNLAINFSNQFTTPKTFFLFLAPTETHSLLAEDLHKFLLECHRLAFHKFSFL